MSTNPRRQPRTDSSFEETGKESQTNSFEVLIQISNKMSTVIGKLDNIATLIKDTNQAKLIESEFKETRDTMAKVFSMISEHAHTTNNMLQQQDNEELKSKMKNWGDTRNERKKMFWLYKKSSKLSEKYKEWYHSTLEKIATKFLPKTIPGEAEEQRAIRMRHAKETMKSEMDIMEIKIKISTSN